MSITNQKIIIEAHKEPCDENIQKTVDKITKSNS